MNYILELHNIFQKYPDKNKGTRTILQDINLKVSPGEFLTVVGPTGCGKSTLFRLILGSEHPFSGRILMNGTPIREPDRTRGIVFQQYSLYPNLTVLQNVMFGLELEEFNLWSKFLNPFHYHKKRQEFKKKANDYLKRMGLLEHAEKYPHELSGGMRQRAAIAQAMVMTSQVILMDEPHGALDVGTREEMQLFVLEQWQRDKQTIIFITHDLEEALFLGSRIIVLSQFYTHDNGTPAEGAKIVKDQALEWPIPRATSIKGSKEFTRIMQEIRREGLDPTFLLKVKEFNLKHKDSIIL